MHDDRELRLRHFVEEMGLLFSEVGGTKMLGRVLGRLLTSETPLQSAAQLAEYLEASAGSISTATRSLVMSGMVERVSLPGERATFFRLTEAGWIDMMRRRTTMLTLMRETADRGLGLLEGAPPERTARLRSFRDFYVFLEDAMPRLYDEYEAHLRDRGDGPIEEVE